tara:strand:+ start:376 stop:1299 length:924 start_codon:yes stop_codon:yes gene_type:complete
MAMRSQVYEWTNIVDDATSLTTTRRLGGRFGAFMGANSPTSVFIGGIGNNISKPASTSATQFVVIEDLACSPHLGMSVQVTINTTDYFQTPDTQTKYGDGTYAGISGIASPYPKGAAPPQFAGATEGATAPTLETGSAQAVLGSFNLYPSIYVLPGQTWDVKASLSAANGVEANITTGRVNDSAATNGTFTTDPAHGQIIGDEVFVSNWAGTSSKATGYHNLGTRASTTTFTLSTEQDADVLPAVANTDNVITYHVSGAAVAAFIKYTLYDGPDALIANKLLEMGVTVNPNNVDWYKRSLIEQGGVA